MIRLANLRKQSADVWSILEPSLHRLLDDAQFIGGPALQAFESAFSRYIGIRECIGVGNGTDALELALEALGIGEGDEVVVPALSYAATSDAVLRVGAQPVFVDVDSDYNLAPDLLKECLAGSNVRAVIPVHLYGNPFDVVRHLKPQIDEGLLVIEDAAQAHGAVVRNQVAGSMGHAAAFSFYPGKNLGAWGDAGCVVTSDENLATTIRRLSNHGRLEKFDHEIAGRNSRLDDLQACVLSAKLSFLDVWLDERNGNATKYMSALGDLEWLILPSISDECVHAWHQFVVAVPDRKDFRQFLSERGIETGVHYPYALPDLPFHRGKKSHAPRAREAAEQVVSLPIGEHLTAAETDRVIEVVAAYRPTRRKT